MQLNKIMLAAVMTLSTVSMAMAEETDWTDLNPSTPIISGGNQGSGTVTFKGSIIDAPCSIEPGSVDQTVKLGAIASAQLNNGGKSTPQEFLIKLSGCDVKTAQTVTTTFNGLSSEAQPGMLALIGTARGASISINDLDGKTLPLGTKSKGQGVNNGAVNLHFSAHLQGDPAVDDAPAVITPGEFNSVADFTLAYQ